LYFSATDKSDQYKKMALETWQQAEQYLKDKAINLVVLDELTYMINYKYLDEQVILNTLNARSRNC
jgi:cob(I)alamin adenosyltransferase